MIQGSRVALISLCLLLTGCNQEFEDISSQKNYRHLVNKEYRTIQALLIHGLTKDNNRRIIDYYAMTTRPGMGGPEVLSSARIEVGSIIRIIKIQRCVNCVFGSPVHIEVELDTEGLLPCIPVRMYRLAVVDHDEKYEVDPAYFEPLWRSAGALPFGKSINQ